MKTKSIAAAFLLGIAPAHSAITVQAHFEMGDNGQGTNNLPLDSSGNGRHFTGAINTATITPTGGGLQQRRVLHVQWHQPRLL